MSIRKTIYLSEEADIILSGKNNISQFINGLIIKSEKESNILQEILETVQEIKEQKNNTTVQILSSGIATSPIVPQQFIQQEYQAPQQSFNQPIQNSNSNNQDTVEELTDEELDEYLL